MKKPEPNSVRFEKVVARILQDLEPTCKVEHNVKLHGTESGVQRQIDVVLRSQVAGIDLLTIVQCKDYGRRVDVNKVHELVGVMRDVGAHRGVLVANSGFSKAARNLARRSGVDLWSVHAAESVDWRLTLRIPVLIQLVELKLNLSGKIQIVDASTRFDRNRSLNPSVANSLNELLDSGTISLTEPTKFELPGPHSLVCTQGIFHPIQEFKGHVVPAAKWFLRYFDEMPQGKAVQWQDQDKLVLLLKNDCFVLPPDAIPYSSREEIPVHAPISLVARKIPLLTQGMLPITGLERIGDL